jgi:hypothetical protein
MSSGLPTAGEIAAITPGLIGLLRAVVELFGGADRVRATLDAEYGAAELAADAEEVRKFGAPK